MHNKTKHGDMWR